MTRLLVRLYPSSWRGRYGEEFEELLRERPIGPFDVADVVLGAIDAHLHGRAGKGSASRTGGVSMSLRLGGYGAIAGGLLWFVSLAGASMSAMWNGPWALLMVLAGVALLVALAGLSAFQARRYAALTWTAFLIPAVGCAVSLVGVVGMAVVGDRPFIGDVSPWYIWIAGTFGLIVGSALFALLALRTALLARFAAALLAVGSIATPFVGLGLGGDSSQPMGMVLMVGALLAFAAGWMAIGLSAVRLDRRPSTGRPAAA
jgi:hypothetical protein